MSIVPLQIAIDPASRGAEQLADLQRTLGTVLRTSGRIGDGSINGGSKLVAGSITTGSIAAGSITTSLLAAGAVVASTIAAHTITAGQIAAGTITSTEIAATTITAANIASSTITATQIAAGTITATQIASGTITAGLLAANAVTSTAIASGAVTATKISVSQLSAIAADLGTITAGTITGATVQTAASGNRIVVQSTGITAWGGGGATVKLNFDTSTGNLTLAGVVTASAGSAIPASTIDATAGGIVSGQIQNGTIIGADIAANTIAANNIVAATITATELAASSVTAVKILANTITAGQIASGTITATQIAAATIDATRMNVTQLSAITANLGTITAGTVTGATLQTSSGTSRIELNGTQMKVVVSSANVITLDPTNGLVITQGTASQNTITWQDASRATTYGYMRTWDNTGISATNLQILATGPGTGGDGYLQFQRGYSGGASNLTLIQYVQASTSVFSALDINGSTVSVRNSGGFSSTLIDGNGDTTVGQRLFVSGASQLSNTMTILSASTGGARLIVGTPGNPFNHGGSIRGEAANKMACVDVTNAAYGTFTAAAFPISSDRKLKTNIATVTGALAAIRSLRGVTFDWKNTGEKSMGVIAQEVRGVYPFLITGTEATEGGPANGLSIHYNGLIGPLIEAVKEVDADRASVARQVAAFGQLLRATTQTIADEIGGQKGDRIAARFAALDQLYTTLAA